MSTAPNLPASPVVELDRISGQFYDQHFGFDAREHAAIALRVPDSGNDWLDAMIRTAQRNDYARQAMQAMITKSSGQDTTGGKAGVPLVAKYAFEYADAMLSASAAHSAEGE